MNRSYQIFVRGLDGKTMTIDVNNNTTVKQVKRFVREKTNIPTNLQNLKHSYYLLRDNLRLVDYNIDKDMTLHLNLRMLCGIDFSTNEKDKINVNIKLPGYKNKKICFEFYPDFPISYKRANGGIIEYLLEILDAEKGVTGITYTSNDVNLIYNGIVLDKNKNACDYPFCRNYFFMEQKEIHHKINQLGFTSTKDNYSYGYFFITGNQLNLFLN